MARSFSHSRRDFIKLSSLALLGSTPITSLANSISQFSGSKELKIFIFSKHLQFLNYREMCNAAKEMGFDGIDLTVRPKGHVLPETVTEDLPKATEAMTAFGLLPLMVTTKVMDANIPTDRKVLETISKLGYKYYRTGWYRYKKDADIQQGVSAARKNLIELAKLNRKLGISGSYHNHSGNFIGASIWDLYQALEGLSPEQMGCQYDISHATIEGGKNWDIDFRLIKNHINTLVVKDFKWGKAGGIWKPVFTALGEGMVNFKKYFSLLKKNNINAPLSIHYEYDLGGAEHGGIPSIDQKEVFKKMKNDLMFIRKVWKDAI